MRRLLVLLCLIIASSSAFADSLRVQIAASSSTRIIATAPSGRHVSLRHENDRLIISTEPQVGRVIIVGHSPLVRSSTQANGQAFIELVSGVNLRDARLGPKTIIDLFAPVESASDQTGSPARRTDPPPANLADLVPGLPDAFRANVENPAGLRPPPKPARPPVQASAARAVPADPTLGSSNAIAAGPSCNASVAGAVLLPFSTDVGVAALRRQGELTLFFDEGRPIDLSALHADPTFGAARVLMHQESTDLVLPIGADQTFGLSRQSGGWCLMVGRTAPARAPIEIETWNSGLRFLLRSPGRVLTATDPASGAVLLIGTDKAADSAVFVTHRSELFSINRSAVGVVVEPFSDRVFLKATRGGFALLADDAGGLSIPHAFAADQAAQTGLTHILATQPTTTTELGRRLREQLATAALTPVRSRLSSRLAAAQSMLELGMGREARTLLRVAFADDPAAATDPRAQFLQAVAAVANDPSSDAFDSPHLPVNDETELWRALTRTTASPSRTNAAIVAGALPLILSYPEHLRDLAAGLAAPLLLADGHPQALAALGRLPVDVATAVPEANGLDAEGDETAALVKLDQLTRSNDLGVSTDAMLSATLLRVRLGKLGAKAASDSLEQHRLDWRATGREGAVMLDEASLARRAGQDVSAIQLWREVERRFPALRQPAQSGIMDTLASLATPKVAIALSPADFVTIVTGSTAELAMRPDVAAELGPALAERLEALDLPARATEILRKLVDATPAGPAAAKLGGKLAGMLVDQGEAAEALAVLDRTDQPNLPSALAEQRSLTRARAFELEGKHDAALAALAAATDAPEQDLRTTILAAEGHWHDAKLGLVALSKTIPEDGVFKSDQADLMMRLATAASRDADKPLLERLARQAQGRWPDPEQRRVFDLMTAPLLSDAKVPARSHVGTQGIQPATAG